MIDHPTDATVLSMVRDALARVAAPWQRAGEAALDMIVRLGRSYDRPSVLYRPSLYMDGIRWCALYGSNIQEGVCGFGDTAEAAMQDFDSTWRNMRGKS